MKFESKLAERIANKKDGKRGWKTYAGGVGAIFIVLNLAASCLAAPSAVIHIGSKTTVVKYLGSYDGRTNVLQFGLTLSTDSGYLRTPFRGHLSDLGSLSFSERVEQAGGGIFEPYIIILLPGGENLVCHPQDSYSTTGWYLPLFEWQLRELVSKGFWNTLPEVSGQGLEPLSVWVTTLGDPQVVAIQLCVGEWSLSDTYSGMIADLSINGDLMNIANAKRV